MFETIQRCAGCPIVIGMSKNLNFAPPNMKHAFILKKLVFLKLRTEHLKRTHINAKTRQKQQNLSQNVRYCKARAKFIKYLQHS